MPDLIIKPQTGSGNSVIIQDQAGGAVLTTADSGVSQLSTPAGHVIQMNYTRNNAADLSRSGDKSVVAGTGITCVLANDLQASSKLFAQFTTQVGEDAGSTWGVQQVITFLCNSVDVAPATVASGYQGGGLGAASVIHGTTNGNYQSANVSGQILFTPTGTGATRRTVELAWCATSTSSYTHWLNRTSDSATHTRAGGTTILLMEIAQ